MARPYEIDLSRCGDLAKNIFSASDVTFLQSLWTEWMWGRSNM